MKNWLFSLICFFSILYSATAFAQRPIGEFYVRYYWDTELQIAGHKQDISWLTGLKIGLPWGPYTAWKVNVGPFFETNIISSGYLDNGHWNGNSGDFGGGIFINWLEHWTMTVKLSSIHTFDSDRNNNTSWGSYNTKEYIHGRYNYLELKYKF